MINNKLLIYTINDKPKASYKILMDFSPKGSESPLGTNFEIVNCAKSAESRFYPIKSRGR